MAPSMVPAFSLCKLLQDVLGKQPTTAEHDSFIHQLKQHVFSLPADADQVPDVDNEFAAMELRSRSLTSCL
jgi:hypothetical protein